MGLSIYSNVYGCIHQEHTYSVYTCIRCTCIRTPQRDSGQCEEGGTRARTHSLLTKVHTKSE